MKSSKVVKIRGLPLETEISVVSGQLALERMGRKELEEYAKNSFSMMTQLTFYSQQLLEVLEELGVKVEPE